MINVLDLHTIDSILFSVPELHKIGISGTLLFFSKTSLVGSSRSSSFFLEGKTNWFDTKMGWLSGISRNIILLLFPELHKIGISGTALLEF